MCKRIGVITYEVHDKVYHDTHYLDNHRKIKDEIRHVKGLWEMNICFGDDWRDYHFISMRIFYEV